ncbi:MAG: CHAT domain-containing protein [Blastocatellia bacterium]
MRGLVGETRRWLISPDGALNLIPFAALVDEQNEYLVKNYAISYLTSGRDLLRLQVARESKQAPMVVADPDFDAPASSQVAAGRGQSAKKPSSGAQSSSSSSAPSSSLAQFQFGRLPGTAAEAQALKALLPEAVVLTRKQATEAALKQAIAPRLLHIATHGFFLEDLPTLPPAMNRGIGVKTSLGMAMNPVPSSGGNPLLRSGLALAGFNLHRGGDDDGVLTAMEATGLNLWGTQMVILSACDTGVGAVKNGQGVYGLRRALVLAGAETQVMSLWPVSVDGTRDLMIEYYKALQAGQGRSEGLRQVQLKLLADPRRQHPYYWASFIQSGEWANLAGKR